MGREDPTSSRSRGFAVLSYTSAASTAISTLVSIDVQSDSWRERVKSLPEPPLDLWNLMEHICENGGILEFLTPCLNPVVTSAVEECREIISQVEATSQYGVVSSWPEGVRSQLASMRKDDRCCDATQTHLPIHPLVLFTLLGLGERK